MGEQRERLQLDDFEVPEGQQFDPVTWLNSRLLRNGVAFERLDPVLNSLGMSCQLLCQETSESIEKSSNQLVAQLPSSVRDLDRMRQEVLKGRDRLGNVLEGLKDADDRKRSGLQGLAEIDAVKSRVEMACSALREIGSWERKVKECEGLVHSGSLPAARQQLASLKEVLEAFRMLPEYAMKEEQLAQLEKTLLRAAQRKTKLAIERNVATDLGACCEVLTGLGRPEEAILIASTFFVELSEKAWQSQAPRGGDAAAADLAAGTKAVFDVLVQSFEERRAVMASLEPTAQAAKAATAAGVSEEVVPQAVDASRSNAIIVSVAQSALRVICKELEGSFPAAGGGASGAQPGMEGTSVYVRAARAVALLAAYVDGFDELAKCAAVAESPGFLQQVCEDIEEAETLPFGLLREVISLVILRPMQDEAAALVPGIVGQMKPLDAVLLAESNAKRLLQMPSGWAQRLEQQGGGRLAEAWLACIDETFAWYWKQWDKLFETFQNTLDARGRDGASEHTLNAALLSECMQLHTLLHDSIPALFVAFKSEMLQHASRLMKLAEPAMSKVLAVKLADPDVWCERLAVPSASSLRSASASVEGLQSEGGASVAGTASLSLQAATGALEDAERRARDLVTQCAVRPVERMLSKYPDEQQWTRVAEAAELELVAGGLLPLQYVTAVIDHLFSLVPHLERPQEQFQWMPTVFDAVVNLALQKALQIRQLSVTGAQQLLVDLEYVERSITAFVGGDASQAVVQLGEFLQALRFLSAQQRRQQECTSKGQPFVPEASPELNRRFERMLRVAVGL